MEILGIGLPEIIFILLLVLVLINPKDMKTTGLTIGRFLRRVVTSPLWQELRSVWAGMTNLPYQLMREANLEDELQSLKQTGEELKNTISPQQFAAFPPHFTQNAAPASQPAVQPQSGASSSSQPAPAAPHTAAPLTPAE